MKFFYWPENGSIDFVYAVNVENGELPQRRNAYDIRLLTQDGYAEISWRTAAEFGWPI